MGTKLAWGQGYEAKPKLSLNQEAKAEAEVDIVTRHGNKLLRLQLRAFKKSKLRLQLRDLIKASASLPRASYPFLIVTRR